MDDKRARLEAIRRKNELRKIELEKERMNKDESPSPAIQVDDIIKKAEEKKVEEEKEKNELIKKQAMELQTKMQKYKSEGLKVSSGLNDVIVVGKKPECYEIDIQCDLETKPVREEDEDEVDTVEKTAHGKRSVFIPANKQTKPLTSKKPPQAHIFEQLEENAKVENKDEMVFKPLKVLSDETKRQLLNSDELQTFIMRNYKYIERALNEKDVFDNFKSYYDDDEGNNVGATSKNWIYNSYEMVDESINKRTVTSLDWSLKHQELMLACYSKSEDAGINDPNGLILLWSMAMRKKPEFTFTCQTEITCAKFHKFNPKLIIGGTYTGQILIWDTRGKPLPVQKTQPGGKFHAYPIYCLDAIGSTNSNNIVSISNDGVMCTWSLQSLAKANKKMELKGRKKRGTDKEGFETISTTQNTEDIGAICMATSENETNHILVGTDDSDIYQVYTHQSSDNNDNIAEVYRKHSGPITSIDLHPGDIHKNTNLSHYFLSTSVDWTINLWSKNDNDGPVVNFDLNDDYVYDAKWHPSNASLFASVDGTGKLDFWDLCKDLEVPAFRYDVGTGRTALNKLCWSHDGKRLVTGDINGKLTLFNLDKEYTTHRPEDSYKLEKVLQNAKNAKMTTKF